MPQIRQRGQGLISTFHSASVGFQRIIVAETIPKVFSVRGVFDKTILHAASSVYRDSLIIPDITVVDIPLRPVKPFPDVLLHHRVLPLDDIILPVLGLPGRNGDLFLPGKELSHRRTIQPRFLTRNACTCTEQKHCADQQAQSF